MPEDIDITTTQTERKLTLPTGESIDIGVESVELIDGKPDLNVIVKEARRLSGQDIFKRDETDEQQPACSF